MRSMMSLRHPYTDTPMVSMILLAYYVKSWGVSCTCTANMYMYVRQNTDCKIIHFTTCKTAKVNTQYPTKVQSRLLTDALPDLSSSFSCLLAKPEADFSLTTFPHIYHFETLQSFSLRLDVVHRFSIINACCRLTGSQISNKPPVCRCYRPIPTCSCAAHCTRPTSAACGISVPSRSRERSSSNG